MPEHIRSGISNFFRDIRQIFMPKYLPWHAFAMVLTYVLVMTGFDWWIVTTFKGSPLQAIGFAAGLIGFFLPVVVPLAFLAVGSLHKSSSLIRTGWLIAQAEITGLLVSYFYKAFTGRPGPVGFDLGITPTDTSHVFRFGFLDGGVFWGWPSSHVMVAIAGAVVVMALYRHNATIKYVALGYAIFMTLGVSITFHWFSDVVAAVIFGTLVGTVVAKRAGDHL